jgi:Protein of unknown function (DUF3037)
VSESRSPFAYTVVRAVPHVERGEFINVGVVLFCREKKFLGARVGLDRSRLLALDPSADAEEIAAQLEAIVRVAEGAAGAGPIACLSQSERFHWLSSPHSTIVQRSEPHTGMTEDPEAMLEHLFRNLVLAPASA